MKKTDLVKVKVGDTVKHKHSGWVGVILEISKRTPGVIVDISDSSGIMCRFVHKDNLEVINETR